MRKPRLREGESLSDFQARWLEEFLHKPSSSEIKTCVHCKRIYQGRDKELCQQCLELKATKAQQHKASRLRRARENQIIEDFSNSEWLELLANSKGFCPGYKCLPHYVGTFNLTLDHIIPISKVPKGHIYTKKDIQPLCKSCNSKKSDTLINELTNI